MLPNLEKGGSMISELPSSSSEGRSWKSLTGLPGRRELYMVGKKGSRVRRCVVFYDLKMGRIHFLIFLYLSQLTLFFLTFIRV